MIFALGQSNGEVDAPTDPQSPEHGAGPVFEEESDDDPMAQANPINQGVPGNNPNLAIQVNLHANPADQDEPDSPIFNPTWSISHDEDGN